MRASELPCNRIGGQNSRAPCHTSIGLSVAAPEQLHLPACEHKARSAPPPVCLCHGSLAFSTEDLLALKRASQVVMLPQAQLKRALPYASSGQAEAGLS